MSLNNHNKPRESKVMKYVNLAGTAVMLNLLFLLACIPVVTLGPALSGLYSGVRYMIRGDGAVQGFWEGFRTNIVRMIIAGVIFTGIIAYFVVMITYAIWLEYSVFSVVTAYAIPAMLVMMVLASLIPLNIYIPYGVVDWLKNGINLICKAPHWVLLSACLLAVPIVCVFWVPEIAILGIVCFVGFWFTLAAFVSTLFLKDGLIDLLEDYREEYPEENEEDEEE